MIKIHVQGRSQNKTIEALPGENLMEVLLKNQIPVASSCRGEGVCSKCRLKILNQTKVKMDEKNLFFQKKFNLESNTILSCQWKVEEELTLTCSYW